MWKTCSDIDFWGKLIFFGHHSMLGFDFVTFVWLRLIYQPFTVHKPFAWLGICIVPSITHFPEYGFSNQAYHPAVSAVVCFLVYRHIYGISALWIFSVLSTEGTSKYDFADLTREQLTLTGLRKLRPQNLIGDTCTTRMPKVFRKPIKHHVHTAQRFTGTTRMPYKTAPNRWSAHACSSLVWLGWNNKTGLTLNWRQISTQLSDGQRTLPWQLI